MSKKRSKGKNSNYNPQRRTGANPEALQTNSKTKKFKPAARNLLWLDLIFLAVCQLLLSKELISNGVATVLSLVGFVLLLTALAIQFDIGKGSKNRLSK